MNTRKKTAVIYALLAALFYAINVPMSKLLLRKIQPSVLAGLLYLGAGIGIFIVSLFEGKDAGDKLSKSDLPFVLGMILLDIAAPIFLMTGINLGSSSSASLLRNFEIAATTVIAYFIFREIVSKRAWVAIFLVTFSSILLSFEGTKSFRFSVGSIFVLLATVSWGLENNCTRSISSKNTFEIVIIKGIFSGLGALVIAFIQGETLPQIKYIIPALLLGFISYGLSIFVYVRAQNTLGAAKTSAYYAVAPFAGTLLSFVILGEKLNAMFLLAASVMAAGTVLVTVDTLLKSHVHIHTHTVKGKGSDGRITRTYIHAHEHSHIFNSSRHIHKHSEEEKIQYL